MGLVVGDNIDLLESLFRTYTSVVWVLLALVVLGAAIYFGFRRSSR